LFVHDRVIGRVRVAFTHRHGGVSTGPWSSLNLAAGVRGEADDDHDSAAAVSANLTRLAETFGVSEREVLTMRQVHGRDVVVVGRAAVGAAPPAADGLVTRTPGLVLLARAADCVPVAIADRARGLAGVAHSGRAGTQAGVVTVAVDALRDLGAAELEAWIGPRVCGACYEVPGWMRDQVAAVEPATWSTTRAGTPGLDLAGGVREQLDRAGVVVHDLADERNVCTMECDDFFSHRRQGTRSGRMGVLVQVQP